MIEWEKHHKPETWVEILKKAGFRKSKIEWLSYKPLKNLGKLLFGNKLFAYLTSSSFILYMKK